MPPSLPEPPLPDDGEYRLADLPPGRRAVVARVEDGNAIGRRLLDLGFVPRTPVSVLRRAPLGDPVVYELRGTRMCLRRSEARRIWVRLQ